MSRDWRAWHQAYDDPGHPLVHRLDVVVDAVGAAVAAMPPGEVRLASLCAGDGRDVVGALRGHPRRADVHARLVELDPDLAAAAATAAEATGLTAEVQVADAGDARVLEDLAPVDVLLLCGIFGNVSDDDVQRTVAAVPTLCRAGAIVVWTRHRREPDLNPSIRRWFDGAGCHSLDHVTGYGEGRSAWSVGVERVDGPVRPWAPARLFRFLDDLG